MGGWGKIQVDGKQSDTDCAAIKKFQSRFGLRPVDGVPGGGTLNVAKRLHASDPSRCGAGSELTACIDLTNQTTYLMRDGKVFYGPTVTRTGYDHPDGKGAPTPSGSFKIIERQRSNFTDSFGVYLNYWQRIMGNNGFHETTTYIHDMSLGSHGCVNLLKADAIYYWNNIKVGTPVKVFGRRPGT
jgi:peptidoglycan hydrolase-like protein with peptidoglycan-binding domain